MKRPIEKYGWVKLNYQIYGKNGKMARIEFDDLHRSGDTYISMAEFTTKLSLEELQAIYETAKQIKEGNNG